MDRLNGEKYIHIELETGQTTNGKRVGRKSNPKGKSIFQIQIHASIRSEEREVGVDKEEGPIYWSLTVQFDSEYNSPVCGAIGNWSWVIRLLRDAVTGGFKEDGSPSSGKRRATPHESFTICCFLRAITLDNTGLPAEPTT